MIFRSAGLEPNSLFMRMRVFLVALFVARERQVFELIDDFRFHRTLLPGKTRMLVFLF